MNELSKGAVEHSQASFQSRKSCCLRFSSYCIAGAAPSTCSPRDKPLPMWVPLVVAVPTDMSFLHRAEDSEPDNGSAKTSHFSAKP